MRLSSVQGVQHRRCWKDDADKDNQVTTNAIDRKQLIVACDSRWSINLDGEHLAYVDDTSFDKIALRQGGCMVCTGDVQLIQRWMSWFRAPYLNLDQNAMPPLNRLEGGELRHIVFHIVTADGAVRDPGIGGTLDYLDRARFAGSGAQYALNCFALNGKIKMCVTSASGQDDQTGGTVKYVELSTGQNNLLGNLSDIAALDIEFNNRGQVMNTKTRAVYSLQEFAAKQAGSNAGSRLSSSNLSAPTGQPPFLWNEEQKGELKAAFSEIVAIEERSKSKS